MGAFEQLLEAWRVNPDVQSTRALCAQLSLSPREELVREVGTRAEQWHAQDGEVMLSVGQMYLEAGLLPEAQTALVSAGKANARDPRAFRYLGEVLLRRGDAARSEKVLQRAVQLGANDPDTKLWHDRAVVYVALQKRVGAQAVASEVARTLPQRGSSPSAAAVPPPPPTRPQGPALAPAMPASPWAEEAPTVRKGQAGGPPPAARPALAQVKPRSVPPPLPPAPAAMPVMPPPPRAPGPPSLVADDDDETTVHQHVPSGHARDPYPSTTGTTTRRQPLDATAPPAGAVEFVQPGVPAQPGYPPPSAPRTAPMAPAYVPIPRGPLEDDADEMTAVTPQDVVAPTPDMVLESLARVGLFEPRGGALPAWEAATPQRSRGSWVLVVATVLVLVVGGSGFAYARKVQKQRAETARNLSDQVEVMLQSGEMAQLKASDETLTRIFELDSRSSRAAKLWLQNRVLGTLILTGETRGVDAAVHRALSVEVPEAEVAFGKIASYLVEGDLAGAAAALPKYDKNAGNDAYYQLTAGAVLERAGDIRAIERYEAARALDAKLLTADILLARAVLLELGPAKAKPVIEELKKKSGETPATRALEALAWAVDSERPKELPKSAQLSDEDRTLLVAPLLPVPAIVQALQAIMSGSEQDAISAIDSAVNLSDSPAMATQLGFLAIKAGDEKLARKAALRALQFSALYPQARVLASRVALLGGRLDEAKKAIEELDPRSTEVAVVRAALAYETLDLSELRSSVEALGEAATKNPDYAALALAPAILMGGELPGADALGTMAQPWVPWGELVAMDAALEQGDFELAEKLVGEWGTGASRPVYALRVARMKRYQEKYEEADKLGAGVMKQGSTTVSVLVERVFTLMALDQPAPARDLISKYPALLGPLAQWLRMYVDAKGGRAAEAKSKATQLDPPPDEAPLLLRVVAARALAVTKDRRAKPYVKKLEKRYKANPEVARAVAELK